MKWLIDLARPGGQLLSQSQLDQCRYPWGYVVTATDWLAWQLKYEMVGAPPRFAVEIIDLRGFICRWLPATDSLILRSVIDGRDYSLSRRQLRQSLVGYAVIVDNDIEDWLLPVIEGLSIYREQIGEAHSGYLRFIEHRHRSQVVPRQVKDLSTPVRSLIEYQPELVVLGERSAIDDKIDYLLTNSMLASAESGRALRQGALLNLMDNCFADQHIPIVEACHCSICRQHTRAYLHHLLHHCHSLAMQYIAIHNIIYFWSSKSLMS